MQNSLVLDDLTKYYDGFLALDDLSLNVTENNNVALLGPNGAGKSTVLKLLCGLIFPSSGEAYVDGINVFENTEKAVARLGTMLETPEFYSYLTPKETLSYLGKLRGMTDDELEDRIEEVLGMVNLGKWNDSRIGNFSRGMKQRLAIAQALLHNPPILILDEPSAGLDPRGMAEVRNIVKKAKEDKTLFFASHLLSEVEQVCDKVALIDHGRLQAYESISVLEEEHGSLENAYLELTEASI